MKNCNCLEKVSAISDGMRWANKQICEIKNKAYEDINKKLENIGRCDAHVNVPITIPIMPDYLYERPCHVCMHALIENEENKNEKL